MRLKKITILGFKSFNETSELVFPNKITSVVGPNGSGKSNIVEAFRFVLGEQSMKSMRGKKGEDLIFNGGHDTSRSNRASVKILFDNRDNFFDIDFDEISLERIVFRDGVNEYRLNDTQVRLQDILEVLSKANVGSQGHHIISQGEADMILNSSTIERKNIIEDGLALNFLQYRKTESQRKILKTKQNLREANISRREMATHLNYLKRRVEHIEEVKEMQNDLYNKYTEYLKKEDLLLKSKSKEHKEEKELKSLEMEKLDERLRQVKIDSKESIEEKSINSNLKDSYQNLSKIQKEKDTLNLQIGRLQGEISARQRMEHQIENESIALSKVQKFNTDVTNLKIESENVNDVSRLKEIITKLISIFEGLKTNDTIKDNTINKNLKDNTQKLLDERDILLESEKKLLTKIATLKSQLDSLFSKGRENKEITIDLLSKRNELEKVLDKIKYGEDLVNLRKIEFEREIAEGKILIGHRVMDYKDYSVDDDLSSINYEKQDEMRKHMERLKIRLEEKGIGEDETTLDEYKELKKRDDLLSHTIDDLESSIIKLNEIITGLEKEIQNRFRQGLIKINKQFEVFFRTLFGGGKAVLRTVKVNTKNQEGDIIVKDGVEVLVNLPQKKVNKLEQLSGGERSLISIALLFAISQVTPPPFLILDETDAALDEANSRRYGDMLEELSKHSQLILVTHNRETMSRADIIYGITIDNKGSSKLLSVNLEEATKVAK